MTRNESTTLSIDHHNGNTNDTSNSSTVTWLDFTLTTDPLQNCPVCSDISNVPPELLVIQLILPVITVIANSITSVAIYKAHDLKPSLRMSLLHLSFTDIIGPLLFMYQIILSWNSFEVNLECIVRYALYVASVAMTLKLLIFMSVDRFISVFTPFAYEKISETRMYVPIAIIAAWITTIGIVLSGFFTGIKMDAEGCFYPLILKSETHLRFGLSGIFTIAVVIALNAVIFWRTRVHIAKIAATLVGLERDRQIARLGTKATTTTLSIVVPYALMNIPMYVLMVYFYFHQYFTKTLAALVTVNGLSNLSLFNSLINPAIYIWRCVQIQREFRKMGRSIKALFSCGADMDGTGSRGGICFRMGKHTHRGSSFNGNSNNMPSQESVSSTCRSSSNIVVGDQNMT